MTRAEFNLQLARLRERATSPGYVKILEYAVALGEALSDDDLPHGFRGSIVGSSRGAVTLPLVWSGHDCQLRVHIALFGYDILMSRQGESTCTVRQTPSLDGLAAEIAYIRDSLPAGSLGLSVEEWRAMTGQRGKGES